MEEACVTAATGALGPVIVKLAALLGSEYKLRWRTRRDVNFIKSKFRYIHSMLWEIWEKQDLDAESKELKREAWDIVDHVDETIDDLIVCMERNRRNQRFIQTKIKESPFKDLKKRVDDLSGRCRSKWKNKKNDQAISSLFSRKSAISIPSKPTPPRDHPFVLKDMSELVGTLGRIDDLMRKVAGYEETIGMEPQLTMTIIAGMAGMGKTTLVRHFYEKVKDKFGARAFVPVTPSTSVKEILTSILDQVAPDGTAATEAATKEEHLLSKLSGFLKDKRYLIIIDDIWYFEEWEIIRESFPENNLGSRIVTTTRIKAIANYWRDESIGSVLQIDLKYNYSSKRWFDSLIYNGYAAEMIAMKPDMVGEGFDSEHPIVRTCDGVPLALVCMFSAVSKEIDQQKQQGKCVKPLDALSTIARQVKRNGIHNTPGFEPLVKSLQLGYDDLPHHMLKTCLIYCSVYPVTLEMDDLVRRWMAEGFVYKEEEARGYFEDLVDRGLILMAETCGQFTYGIHPVMRDFLKYKSRENNFISWSSDISSSYDHRIGRLCVDDDDQYDGVVEQVDEIARMSWSHIKSLVSCGDAMRIPLEKLERLRVLDVQCDGDLENHHLKDICGLVYLRYLGIHGSRITEVPPDIGRLKRLEHLEVSGTNITRLPGEIGSLQQLKTLFVGINFQLKELPWEIGSLQQLKILDINVNKGIKELPKEIWKLQNLEQLVLTRTGVTRIPREIGEMNGLKVLKLDDKMVTLPLEVAKWVRLPECIQQAWNKSDLVSTLAGEILSYQKKHWDSEEGGLVVGAKHMHIPRWIKEHFNDLANLDIRICKLGEQDLKILSKMPNLVHLTLRFEFAPREQIAITSGGFARLVILTIESRVPRLTFYEGAMPWLQRITFELQYYGGPPSTDPMGIKHLQYIQSVRFDCNMWYSADNPCISATIDMVRKEAQEHPNDISFFVTGRKIEKFWRNKDT